MRALLTGCNGYIGRRLAPLLQRAGWLIEGLDRTGSPPPGLDGFVECDLQNPAAYSSLLESCDTVFHLAAAKGDWGVSDEEYTRDNVEATSALIRAGRAAGVRQWFHYSTVAVLGPSSIPVGEDAPRQPTGSYGKTKAACEELFEELAAADPESQILILRPSAVFGPEHPENTNLYRLIYALARNRFLFVGDGKQRKSTSYIDNLVAATAFLAGRFRPGVQKFHYVDDPVLTMDEMVLRLCRGLGRSQPKVRIPLAAVKWIAGTSDVVARIAGVDIPITRARIAKFCTQTVYGADKIRTLGFTPPWSIDEALQKTIESQLVGKG